MESHLVQTAARLARGLPCYFLSVGWGRVAPISSVVGASSGTRRRTQWRRRSVAEDADVSGDILACMTELVKAVRRLESLVKTIPQDRISERIAEQILGCQRRRRSRSRTVPWSAFQSAPRSRPSMCQCRRSNRGDFW